MVRSLASGRSDRLDDLWVGRAAAEITREIVSDLIVVGVGVLVEELLCHQDEPGCAKTALKRAGFDEGLLDRIELSTGPEMFDGDDVGAIGRSSEKQTTRDRESVDQYRAAAAQTLTTALTRAEEIEFALQQLDEIVVLLGLGCDLFTVEREMNGPGHVMLPSAVH